jgi:hypothetical protein
MLRHPPHRRRESLLRHGLEKVVERLHVERADRVFVVGREEHHGRHSLHRAAADDFERIGAWHLDVEKNHVRLQCVESLQDFVPVAAFADDPEISECL